MVHFYIGGLVATCVEGPFITIQRENVCGLTKDGEGSEKSWTSNTRLATCWVIRKWLEPIKKY